DLLLVDVKGRHELDVPDVISAEVDVHEAGHEVLAGCVAVVVNSLDKGGRAVANPDDGDPDLAVALAVLVAVLLAVLHAPISLRDFIGCLIPISSSRSARPRAMLSTSREQYTCRPSRRVRTTPPTLSIRRCQEMRGWL